MVVDGYVPGAAKLADSSNAGYLAISGKTIGLKGAIPKGRMTVTVYSSNVSGGNLSSSVLERSYMSDILLQYMLLDNDKDKSWDTYPPQPSKANFPLLLRLD